MMVNKYILIGISLILTFISLVILKLSYLKGGLLTLALVVLGYIVYIGFKQRKRYGILEEDLDPEKFIEASHHAYRYAGEDGQLKSLLNSDLAYGYMSLGDYGRADYYLNKVEPERLPQANRSILAYYNARMIVYFELGQRDRGQALYEEAERVAFKGDLAQNLMDLMRANRYFYLGEYEESRRLLEAYPRKRRTRRLNLELEFELGLIDEREAKTSRARERFSQVAQEGKGLHIRGLAEERLKALGQSGSLKKEN